MDSKRININQKHFRTYSVFGILGFIIVFISSGYGRLQPNDIPKQVSINKSYQLPDVVFESSGLIYSGNLIWTFNDSGGDPELFAFSLPDTHVIKRTTLWNAYNFDWEDITQDSSHIFIGDTGNNFGNRENLCIYRINKKALYKHKNSAVKGDKIFFTYPGYKPVSILSFTKSAFDCEAMVWHNDSIYLFTKDWITLNTTIYSVPSVPGAYTAHKIREFKSECLITAADSNGNMLLLLGYRNYKVFLWKFNSLEGFLSGKDHGRQIELSVLGKAQAEGIAIKNDSTVFISAEGAINAMLWEVNI
jgi:hypothetical protein